VNASGLWDGGGLAKRHLECPSECQLPSSHPGQTESHDFCMQSEPPHDQLELWCGVGEGTWKGRVGAIH